MILFLDIYVTNCRIGQLLHHSEIGLQQKLAYQQQLDSLVDDFGELFKSEGRMGTLIDHLNQCAEKLVRKLYSTKQLVVSGAPTLRWDWRHVRVRGSSGSTGSFSKSFGVTQSEFQKRLRAEEEVCRLKMPKVSRAKPPAMKNRSVQSIGWESMMSLVGNMKFWNGPGGRSPLKKRTKVERKGNAVLPIRYCLCYGNGNCSQQILY